MVAGRTTAWLTMACGFSLPPGQKSHRLSGAKKRYYRTLLYVEGNFVIALYRIVTFPALLTEIENFSAKALALPAFTLTQGIVPSL